MSGWYRLPSRSDVILMPRDWRFKFYSRGIMFSITGKFSATGTVSIQWFRIGPAELCT